MYMYVRIYFCDLQGYKVFDQKSKVVLNCYLLNPVEITNKDRESDIIRSLLRI